MKKNFNVPFRNWKGEVIVTPVKNENGEGTYKPQIMGDIVGKVLFEVIDRQDMQLSGEEKLRAYRIACKIGKDAENVDIEAEDIILIKKILCPVMAVGGYGQIVDLLEG